ncbi:MAG: hypothetical protein P8I38_13330 [Arenicella sp.]|jgi:hypothetical protein|nr:hypothetical protein [Arenicella sp.]
MTSRSKLWLISALIYSTFVFWYTDFGGPVTESEIQDWKKSMQANGTSPERIAYYERFLKEDTGRQFLMLNAIDVNENPPHVEGAEPGESADQLMGRYMEHMLPELLGRASHPVIIGSAPFTAIDLVGIEGAENWDQGAFFRYRSRRDFMHIIANPTTLSRHKFKLAALEKTIAYPVETSLYLGDPRLLLGLLILALTALLDSFWISRRID